MPPFIAYALHDFRARHEFELGFTKGERLQVLDNHGNGWLHSENPTGDRGIVPENYITTDFRLFSALHSFHPTRTYEIGFEKGDAIVVFSVDPKKEWWEGCAGGKCGLFPRSFVAPPATALGTTDRSRERSRSRDRGGDIRSSTAGKRKSSRSRSRPRVERRPRSPQAAIPTHLAASSGHSGSLDEPASVAPARGNLSQPPPPPSQPPQARAPPAPPSNVPPTLATRHPAPNIYHSMSVGAIQTPPSVEYLRVSASASNRIAAASPVTSGRRGNSDDVRILHNRARKQREESQRLPSNPAFQRTLHDIERQARTVQMEDGDEFGVEGSITDEERAAETRRKALRGRLPTGLSVPRHSHSRSRSTGRPSAHKPSSAESLKSEKPLKVTLDVENERLKEEISRLRQHATSLEEECQALRKRLDCCTGSCRQPKSLARAADNLPSKSSAASRHLLDGERPHWTGLEPPAPPPTRLKYPPELNGYLSSPPATQSGRRESRQ